jgi:hypothetical protein
MKRSILLRAAHLKVLATTFDLKRNTIQAKQSPSKGWNVASV